MAEFVARRMEEKIPFLELLKLTELFNAEEIGEIVEKFTNHEYKIQRREREVEDILKYAEFQVQFLNEIQARREKTNYFHKTDQIESVIKSQINTMFGIAAQKFHDRLELWSARINFTKAMGWPTAVRKNFEQVTKLLGRRYPQLWIEASNYEWSLHPPKFIDTSRKILQLGLRDHPDSEALFIAAFRLELKYVNILERNPKFLDKVLKEDNGDLIVNQLALAKVIYSAAKKNSKKSDKFYLKFFLALSDVDPVKAQSLLDSIKVDAEADMEARQGSISDNQELSSVDLEESILTQFQNFQLFFSNFTDVKKALRTADIVDNLSFWTRTFLILSLKKFTLNMNDWFDLCLIPKSHSVTTQLRIWVLNFYSLEYSKGLKKARKWYKKVSPVYPTSPHIHLVMVNVELQQAEPDFSQIQKIFDHVILLHGKDFMEPWIEYLRFEKKYRPRENNYCVVHGRALRELNPSLQEPFRISLLRENHY